jgi:linker histone H1 and H5 family
MAHAKPLTKTYLEMIEDGIITLADRKGASRQALWKCVSSKYPESDYKHFIVRLKKLAHEGPI